VSKYGLGRGEMEPLVVLVVVTAMLLGLGALGVRRLRPGVVALRGGLAAMFTMTASAHFVGLRDQLVAMVPPVLPAPELLVTITGLLEFAGAAGLLWARTAPWAAGGLSALLVAMFPANVHWALSGRASDFAETLWPRTGLQLIFLAATIAVVVHYLRSADRALAADRRPSELMG
jgi:uncharacterized membrane protein